MNQATRPLTPFFPFLLLPSARHLCWISRPRGRDWSLTPVRLTFLDHPFSFSLSLTTAMRIRPNKTTWCLEHGESGRNYKDDAMACICTPRRQRRRDASSLSTNIMIISTKNVTKSLSLGPMVYHQQHTQRLALKLGNLTWNTEKAGGIIRMTPWLVAVRPGERDAVWRHGLPRRRALRQPSSI